MNMAEKLKSRKDVPVELTWDLTGIYPTEEAMLSDVEQIKKMTHEIEKDYKEKLSSAAIIGKCLDDYRALFEKMYRAGNYVELATSVDYTDSHLQQISNKVSTVISDCSSRLSFIRSEIIIQPEAVIKEAIDKATANKHYLEDILRSKPYMFHPEAERIIAALNPTLSSPYFMYETTKMADMDFESFTVDGKEYPLGYSLFEDSYEYNPDTKVRRAAFNAFSKKIKQYENTTAACYQTQVQREKIESSLRGYTSVFDFLLFDQKVDRSLYDRQIDLIMENLAPHMRKYARLLKKVHKLDKMTYADLKVPVDPDYSPDVTIDGAREYIENGLSILGEDYVKMIRSAFEDRWIDFAQNKGKSTGGFCASPYGTNSFILLSWHGQMSDVFTLAHELGHAGHFKACNNAQSIFDTDVSTYFVESPSTMNELLMADYLKKTNDDKRFKRWILSNMIGNTYYHNFVTHLLEAAYQREVYKIIDEGGSVQAETLNRIMKSTLEKFWGNDVEIIDGAELTWMRQPHYYMGLYSYTYSAGLTIATQVSKRIEEEGQTAVDDWKKVLAAGSTLTPVQLAALAKVDITTDAPLLDTIETIGKIIDEICQLTDELEA